MHLLIVALLCVIAACILYAFGLPPKFSWFAVVLGVIFVIAHLFHGRTAPKKSPKIRSA